jgi:PPOX class probable F420-dependent enzyme
LLIDTSSEFGKRVARRLSEEPIAWFTTVSKDGIPQPRPVWFLWNGQSFLIFSQPQGFKVRHLRDNPNVSLHLDGDGQGGDIIVFVGEAHLEEGLVPKTDLDAYMIKYRDGLRRIGMTPDSFTESYQTVIRMKPSKLRGH